MGTGFGIVFAFITVLFIRLSAVRRKATKSIDDSFHHWYNNNR